ncbi:MAG: sensor histidine kinase, partial [Chloroflexus sp.]
DARGRVVLLNPSAQHLLQPLLPERGEVYLHQLPLNGSEVHSELFGRSERVIQVGNRFLTVSRAPVLLANDTLSGEVIVLHDITSAIQIDRAKTDFIATISHELRTPLTIIRGYVDLMLRQATPAFDATQREMLEQVKESTIQMSHLINNAIMVASLDAGKIETRLQAITLAPVVEAALRPLRAAFHARGVQVMLALPDDLPLVIADRELLQHVLGQLLDNARRYVPQGRVIVSAGVEAHDIWLAVSDTGPGIPEDVIGRLFTRFQRVDGNNSTQRGGGLGLAIARQLIELQGGTIAVTSIPGQGSTFTIRLRCAKEQSRAVAGQPSDGN